MSGPVSQKPTGLLQRLVGVIFPARCAGCGMRATDLCDECRTALPWLGEAVCAYCASPSRLARICGTCEREDRMLDGVRAACRFDGVVREAIHDLKYRRIRSRASVLADLLVDTLDRRPLAVDLLVPVPLAPARMRRRGFNQSALVAHLIGARLGLEVAPEALKRTRETVPQVGRSAAERRANIEEAFACTMPGAVSGRRVALVDDVMTTGATLAACAEPLRAAGATRIYGLVVARDL